MESRIALIIRSLDGSELAMNVPADTTSLGELKKLVGREKGAPPSYNICLGTRLLSDDSATLSALGIRDNMTLTLVAKLAWKFKHACGVQGMVGRAKRSQIIRTEAHEGYHGKPDDVIGSAKARCEEEGWAGFVLVNTFNGCPGPLDYTVHYLANSFREGADAVPMGRKSNWFNRAGDESTESWFSLYYIG